MNAIVPESGFRAEEAERGVAEIEIGVAEGTREIAGVGEGEEKGSAIEVVGGAKPQPATITKRGVRTK
jgi:hypothetical protein